MVSAVFELIYVLAALAAIICSLAGCYGAFYILGSFVVFVSAFGVLSGAIRHPGKIIGSTLLAVVYAAIFKDNTYENIMLMLCIECIYSYIRGIIIFKRFEKELALSEIYAEEPQKEEIHE